MAHNSIFRIFSMTNRSFSVGIMMLTRMAISCSATPCEIHPEFADQKVASRTTAT